MDIGPVISTSKLSQIHEVVQSGQPSMKTLLAGISTAFQNPEWNRLEMIRVNGGLHVNTTLKVLYILTTWKAGMTSLI
jgi:hypothetical protein